MSRSEPESIHTPGLPPAMVCVDLPPELEAWVLKVSGQLSMRPEQVVLQELRASMLADEQSEQCDHCHYRKMPSRVEGGRRRALTTAAKEG